MANCQSQVKSTNIQATSHGQQVQEGEGTKRKNLRMKALEKEAHEVEGHVG